MADLAVTTYDRNTLSVTLSIPRGHVGPLSGRMQLGQQFIIGVLKTPGSEPLARAKTLGGGLIGAVGRVLSEQNLRGVAMVSVLAVDQQMHDAQAESTLVERLDTETISSASLIDVTLEASAAGVFGAEILTSLISAEGIPFALRIDGGSVAP